MRITVKPSLAAQDINAIPIAYVPDRILHPGPNSNLGCYSWLGQATYFTLHGGFYRRFSVSFSRRHLPVLIIEWLRERIQ